MAAAGLVVPTAVLAFGTFVQAVPLLGTVGPYFFPEYAPQFFVIALAGAALALVAAGRRSRAGRRAALTLAAVGVLTALGAAVVVARQVRVAAANGANVDLLRTVVPRNLRQFAGPDETVTYAHVDGRDLRMDIYRPRDGSTSSGGPVPVAIYTHGGGWTSGDRMGQTANLRWYADHGYLAVSADYVLATAGRPTWNTAGAQVACALGWLAANVGRFGGDPDRLFSFGESAGGALLLSTAYAAAKGPAGSACGGQVPRLRAVTAHVPAVDPFTFYENPDLIHRWFARRMVGRYLGGSPRAFPDRAAFVSSATYVNPAAPPTLIVLSDDDHLVPIAGALAFVERAQAAGVTLHVVRFPLADHGTGLQFYGVINQALLQMSFQHFCRYGGVCDPPRGPNRSPAR